MRALSRGQIKADDAGFAESMYYCVGCRACETACPAGVEFGRLLEDARNEIEASRSVDEDPFARAWLLDRILPYPKRLKLAARALRRYQRWLGRPGRRGWLEKRYPQLAQLAPLAPQIPSQNRRWRPPTEIDPSEVGNGNGARRVRGAVAVHPGCVQAVVQPEVNADTAQVLAYNGWHVTILEDTPCCGALHAHHGRPDEARALARANIAAFEASPADVLVSNAAGCGAALKQYGVLLQNDPDWAERASNFSDRVVDVSEHLVKTGVRRPLRPFSLSATYDDPCHLIHGQRVAEAPRMLLGAIPGLDLVQLRESTWCCGSAGIYNLTHAESAGQLLERKLDRIAETGAELVVTGNPGCMFQIASGLRARGSPVRVVHPVSLLRIAYELQPLIPR